MTSMMLLCWIFAVFFVVTGNASVIIEENKLKGTSDWWIPQPNSTNFGIEGFTDRISYISGNTIQFKVKAVHSIKRYSIQVYRLGYYGGLGGRLIASIDPITVKPQPNCSFVVSSRLTDCSNWQSSVSWTIPTSATTGLYVAIPVSAQYNISCYIPFVVKQSLTFWSSNQYKIKGSDVLFKISDLTWLAYNLFGGYNVYKSTTDRSFSARASQASFNRPFQNRYAYPLGQHQNFLFGSEFAMIYWLEKHGYDVSYIAGEDLELLHEANVLSPSNYRAVLSVGHDEYWTQKMKDAFIAARNQGVSLAFFSGNEGFWRVRWADPVPFDRSNGKALVDYYNGNKQTASYHRTIICRKETIDNVPPATPNEWTGTFVDPRHRPADPENSLTGQLFLVNSFRHEPIELKREHMLLWFWRNASFVKPGLSVGGSGSVVNVTHSLNQHLSHMPRPKHSGAYRRRRSDVSRSGSSSSSGSSNSGGVASSAPTTGNRLLMSPEVLQREERRDSHWRQLKASRLSRLDMLAHSRPAYISPPGYLGYEMDIFVDDCYRPAGLIALSHTERNITAALSEQYGASYRGSGVISHKLTMYRHVVREPSAATVNSGAAKISAAPFNFTSKMIHTCQFKRLFTPSLAPSASALVFGAGTIQWSWALSDWHDGLPTPIDPAVQQATLNLLADMKVMPGSFQPRIDGSDIGGRSSDINSGSGSGGVLLAFPTVSKDNLPPFSVITTNRLTHVSSSLHRRSWVHIKGVAYDKGGGRVAAVEVSLNGGKNWHLATGRERWKFSFKVADDFSDQKYGTHNCSAMNAKYMAETREEATGGAVIAAYRDSLIHSHQLYDPYSAHKYSFVNTTSKKETPTRMNLLILSRAVDDRGWMEEVAYNRVFCGLFSNRNESVKESRNVLLMNVVLEA